MKTCNYKQIADDGKHLLTACLYEYSRTLKAVTTAIIAWRKACKKSSDADLENADATLRSFSTLSHDMKFDALNARKHASTLIKAKKILERAPEIFEGTPVELLVFLFLFKPFPSKTWIQIKRQQAVPVWERWWTSKCKSYSPIFNSPLHVVALPDSKDKNLLFNLLKQANVRPKYLLAVDWKASDSDLIDEFQNWLADHRPHITRAKLPIVPRLGSIALPGKPNTLILSLSLWKMKSSGLTYPEMRRKLNYTIEQNEEADNRRIAAGISGANALFAGLFPALNKR